jgi:hypothetical protein
MTVVFGICGNNLAREVTDGTDPVQLDETGGSAITGWDWGKQQCKQRLGSKMEHAWGSTWCKSWMLGSKLGSALGWLVLLSVGKLQTKVKANQKWNNDRNTTKEVEGVELIHDNGKILVPQQKEC